MKKIIIPGENEYIFKCSNCGCVFSDDNIADFRYSSSDTYISNGMIITCKCPQCSGVGIEMKIQMNYDNYDKL